MKTWSLFSALCLFVSAAFGTLPTRPELKNFHAPVVAAQEVVPGFIWLEAESFADYGAWRLDTQFTHEMGSAYLLAAGVLKPIASAKTSVFIPRAGLWRVWARTKDWLPEHSPGRFALSVNGTRSCELGASRQPGWRWEPAGDFTLAAGSCALALDDLSGAFARCDALLLTTDLAFVPSNEPAAVAADRVKFTGQKTQVADRGAWDVVVVGAGPAGVGAAIAAARTGARVALVHDRPLLGGNSSVEIGVPTGGAAEAWPNRRPNMRETGLCEEANLRRGRTREKSLSAAYRQMVDLEKGLEEFANQRVVAVEKKGTSVAAIISRDTLTGAQSRFQGKIVIDCSGDGWVGYFALAEYMFGREAQAEFNEAQAPETRDDLIMSGSLLENFSGYRYAVRREPVPYVTPKWAEVLPKGFTRRVRDINYKWWIEHAGRFNELADAERARDELVRINFAYWGWLKNQSHLQEKAANAELTQVPFMLGRRESRRLVGDYILAANDILAGRMFDDRITYGGWPLDTHDPLGMENPTGDGYWRVHPGVPTYSIPYRSLYSRNIDNLMFAGRCFSATHMALGSVRVEATLFTMGQAAGTAAALAVARGLSPRAYGARHMRELQQRLLRDDLYIPELKNEDPADFARTAKVSATSERAGMEAACVIDGVARSVEGARHCWVSAEQAGLPQALRLDFAQPVELHQVRLTFDTDLTPPQAPHYSKTLVRAYVVEGWDGSRWIPLAEEKDNFLRLRVHDFPPVKLSALRVNVLKTWGEPFARIFEVRAY